jgi:hypothetical protein
MNRISIVISFLILVLMFCINAHAQNTSVYSWTDKDGVVHFSDMAPGPDEAQDAEIQETRVAAPGGTSPDQEPADAQTLNNEVVEDPGDGTEEELSYADQKRAEMQANREAANKKAAERDRMCLQARDQVARLEPSRRVFYTNEEGETARMDDDERVKAVEEAKRVMSEYCN